VAHREPEALHRLDRLAAVPALVDRVEADDQGSFDVARVAAGIAFEYGVRPAERRYVRRHAGEVGQRTDPRLGQAVVDRTGRAAEKAEVASGNLQRHGQAEGFFTVQHALYRVAGYEHRGPRGGVLARE